MASATASPATAEAKATKRGIGWEFVHVCIDDDSRIAFAKVMADEKKESAVAFLKAARRLLRRASASRSSA